MNKCKECKYFEECSGAREVGPHRTLRWSGYCRRFPPVPISINTYRDENHLGYEYPAICGDDWCGEWKKK